ncbi:RNA polymerase sigma factor [Thalassoglobus sp. JC818]|uniref:RNA polymerase sigma factor n=1 Tax=Thalassoglobus sp. JC818 TaxID=3232136 RepID=UPI00345ABAE1
MTDRISHENMTDDELMILIQAGTLDAFNDIVERYQGMLVGFFLRNTRDVQLSEDLAQETLLKVYNQAWDYLPLGRFRGWMFRIARNLLIDSVRRRTNDALVQAVKWQPQTEDNALNRIAEEIFQPEERVQHVEFASLIDELLAEIPDDQRQTFVLHHYSELSLPEVSEVMEVPLATCKSRLRLAREKLADKLHARGIGPQGLQGFTTT